MAQDRFNTQRRLKGKLILLFFLLVGIDSFCQSSTKIKKAKDERLAETFGFIEGQNKMLSKIESDFSHLKLEVLKAKSTFNSSFGEARKNLIFFLINSYGEIEFENFKNSMELELKEILKNQEFNEDAARKFLAEVESRANGQISTPVLETLLQFQFYNNPQDEFINNYVQTFRTKNHPKSKGTDWQIKIPLSWLASEGERPNIIQKFTSNYGDGSEIIMLMVKDLGLPKAYKLSEDELNILFTEKGIKSYLPKNSKFISFKKINLDNHLGGMIIMEQIVDRLDFKVKIRLIQFCFIRENKLHFIQCGVNSTDVKEDLNVKLNYFIPFFRQVANSLVVNDQYK